MEKKIRKPRGEEEKKRLRLVSQAKEVPAQQVTAILMDNGDEYVIQRGGLTARLLYGDTNHIYLYCKDNTSTDAVIAFTPEDWARFLEHGKQFLEE